MSAPKRKYIVVYRTALRFATAEIEAVSKYDAKRQFYHQYPKYEIVSVKEVEGDEQR